MFNLPYIPTSEELVDKSFRHGSEKAKAKRSTRKPREKRLLRSEEARVKTIGKIIKSDLKAIVKNFPSYDQLPSFYQKLLDIRVDKDRYKKSLGAVQWCINSIERIERESLTNIRRRRDTGFAREFLGRSSSMVAQISGDLDELIDIKKTLRGFPAVEDLPTLVIAGYPNVGKSTFMKNLTGSGVKIASYPFTTKQILIGHRKIKHQRYQIIDSPGILDRSMEKRNQIELQAILAISELADRILFLIDPSQEIEAQINLLKEIEKGFKIPITVAINKKDMVDKEALEKLNVRLKLPSDRVISAKDIDECVAVFEDIMK
jgi:nucleolar GTP-binding protein